MNLPLEATPTKFQVKIGERVIGEASSRGAVDLILNRLTESERSQAQVVPVASNGNAVLLG